MKVLMMPRSSQELDRGEDRDLRGSTGGDGGITNDYEKGENKVVHERGGEGCLELEEKRSRQYCDSHPQGGVSNAWLKEEQGREVMSILRLTQCVIWDQREGCTEWEDPTKEKNLMERGALLVIRVCDCPLAGGKKGKIKGVRRSYLSTGRERERPD